MSDLKELLITSDGSGQLGSAAVWDPSTGTLLHTYKGGGVMSARCLCLINDEFVLSAEKTKHLLRLWSINGQQPVQGSRLVSPGVVNALAASPDGHYLVAGIDEKIYVWQLGSGRLCAVAAKHYQKITSIKFMSEYSHFVTVGTDGMLLVWNLSELVSRQSSLLVSQSTAGETDPVFLAADHSRPITDLHVGKFGLKARIVTVSADRTCKIYSFLSREMLLSLVFDEALTSVTADLAEHRLYVGAESGRICEYSLLKPPRTREYHLSAEEKSVAFVGHSKAVVCLSVSPSGENLVSTSLDEQVIIWHVGSKQKIRTIPLKGVCENAFYTLATKNLQDHNFKPRMAFKNISRSTESQEGEFVEVAVKARHTIPVELDRVLPVEEEAVGVVQASPADIEVKEVVVGDGELLQEIGRLKSINTQMYKWAVEYVVGKDSKLKTVPAATDISAKKAKKRKWKKSL